MCKVCDRCRRYIGIKLSVKGTAGYFCAADALRISNRKITTICWVVDPRDVYSWGNSPRNVDLDMGAEGAWRVPLPPGKRFARDAKGKMRIPLDFPLGDGKRCLADVILPHKN